MAMLDTLDDSTVRVKELKQQIQVRKYNGRVIHVSKCGTFVLISVGVKSMMSVPSR